MSIINVIEAEQHHSDVIPSDLNITSVFKSEYFLPKEIKPTYNENGDIIYYCFCKDKNVWLKFSDLSLALCNLKINPKWTECPIYKEDKYKIGYKYVDMNNTNYLKKYLGSFYPGKINLKEGETLESIGKIWVYNDGYFSYKRFQKERMNLSPNCTNLKDGGTCPGMVDGTCPFNHYVISRISSRPCRYDIDYSRCLPCGNPKMKSRSMCPEIDCPYDHSVQRFENRICLIDLKNTLDSSGGDENRIRYKYLEIANKHLNKMFGDKNKVSYKPDVVLPNSSGSDNFTDDDNDDCSIGSNEQLSKQDKMLNQSSFLVSDFNYDNICSNEFTDSESGDGDRFSGEFEPIKESKRYHTQSPRFPHESTREMNDTPSIEIFERLTDLVRSGAMEVLVTD